MSYYLEVLDDQNFLLLTYLLHWNSRVLWFLLLKSPNLEEFIPANIFKVDYRKKNV